MMKFLGGRVAHVAVAAIMMGSAVVAQAEPAALARASGELVYTISKIVATGQAPAVTWLSGSVPTGSSFKQYANLEQTQNANDPQGGFAGSTTPLTALVDAVSVTMVNQAGFGLVQANSSALGIPGTTAASGTLAKLNAQATGAYGASGNIAGQRLSSSDIRYARAFTLGPNTRITFTLKASSSAALNDFQAMMNGRTQFWTAMTDTYLYAGEKHASGYYQQQTNSYMYTLQERYFGSSQGYAAGDAFEMQSNDMVVTFDNPTTVKKSGAVWAITQASTNITQ